MNDLFNQELKINDWVIMLNLPQNNSYCNTNVGQIIKLVNDL